VAGVVAGAGKVVGVIKRILRRSLRCLDPS